MLGVGTPALHPQFSFFSSKHPKCLRLVRRAALPPPPAAPSRPPRDGPPRPPAALRAPPRACTVHVPRRDRRDARGGRHQVGRRRGKRTAILGGGASSTSSTARHAPRPRSLTTAHPPPSIATGGLQLGGKHADGTMSNDLRLRAVRARLVAQARHDWSGKCLTSIDTGTRSSGPPEFVSRFKDRITPQNGECGARARTAVERLRLRRREMKPSDYLVKMSGSCVPGIRERPPRNTRDYVFGEHFLRSFYVTFDTARRTASASRRRPSGGGRRQHRPHRSNQYTASNRGGGSESRRRRRPDAAPRRRSPRRRAAAPAPNGPPTTRSPRSTSPPPTGAPASTPPPTRGGGKRGLRADAADVDGVDGERGAAAAPRRAPRRRRRVDAAGRGGRRRA